MPKITRVILDGKEFPISDETEDCGLVGKTVFNEPMNQIIITMFDDTKIEVWVNNANVDKLRNYLQERS